MLGATFHFFSLCARVVFLFFAFWLHRFDADDLPLAVRRSYMAAPRSLSVNEMTMPSLAIDQSADFYRFPAVPLLRTAVFPFYRHSFRCVLERVTKFRHLIVVRILIRPVTARALLTSRPDRE